MSPTQKKKKWARPNSANQNIREKWTFAAESPLAMARSITRAVLAPKSSENRPRIFPSNRIKFAAQLARSGPESWLETSGLTNVISGWAKAAILIAKMPITAKPRSASISK